MNEQIQMPRVMDSTGQQELRRLRCSHIRVKETMVPLSTAEITLENGEEPPEIGSLVEIFSLTGSMGLFVAEGMNSKITRDGESETVVTLSHAAAILGNRVIAGYREMGGVGKPLRQCMAELVEGTDFTVGVCDFSTNFSYSFENENLLTALLSLAEPLQQENMFLWDFHSYPWRVSLVALGDEASCEIGAERNLTAADVTIDSSNLATKIYPVGYGEGADRLNIANMNGGCGYLISPNAGKYGIRESILSLPNVTDERTLMSMGSKALLLAENPRISVQCSAADFQYLTHSAYDRPEPGKMCRFQQMKLRIRNVEHEDLVRKPQLVRVDMGGEGESVDTILQRITRQAKITALYSQGAASEYSMQFADNCDESHPAKLRFYIDRDCIHINRVAVHFSVEKFRSYSRSTSSSGSEAVTSKGGGSTQLNSPALHIPVQNDGATGFIALPGHRHTLINHTHTVDIPSHSHNISYGIYETGGNTQVEITVDGCPVPSSAISGGNFDAIPYMRKDAAGKILRSSWHEIVFTPGNLARISATLTSRTFIRSMEGRNM